MSLEDIPIENLSAVTGIILNLLSRYDYDITYDPSRGLILFRRRTPTPDADVISKIIKRSNRALLLSNIRQYIPNLSSYESIVYDDGSVELIIRLYDKSEETVSRLPSELYIQMAINMDYKEIEALCSTDKRFVEICKNNDFWRQLLQAKTKEILAYSDNYNYREMFKAFDYLRWMYSRSSRTLKRSLERYLNNLLIDISALPNRSVSDFKGISEAIRYYFNNDASFREKILNRAQERSKITPILIFAVAGDITAARNLLPLLDLDEVLVEELVKLLLVPALRFTDYKIIDLILDLYPDSLDTSDIQFALSTHSYDINKEKMPDFRRKLLSDSRIPAKFKDHLLFNAFNLMEPEEFESIINLYRTQVDKEFLVNFLEGDRANESSEDMYKFILKKYFNLFTAEDIGDMIIKYLETTHGDVGNHKLLYILYNQPQMRQKHGDI